MLFTLIELQAVFPEHRGNTNQQINFKEISSDSRLVMDQALFVPIVGDNFDGHAYIEKAIEQGAVATLWDKSKSIPENISADIVFFLVADTTLALQQLARYYRDKINPIVIGITGSNGKTTTKDILNAVLRTKYKTHATKGNFNNHLGLPFTILQMEQDTEVLILEMGMSAFKEIDVLTKIAQPNYAIITNIGESHIEHLGSVEGIAQAKLEIMNGLQEDGKLIIDGDESLLNQVKSNRNVICCGFQKENDVVISDIALKVYETFFTIDEKENFTVPLLGRHHAKNASYVIAIAKLLELTLNEIQTGLTQLEHTGMRFELVDGINDVAIINDAYNASVTSMKAAIEVVKEMAGFKKKILVLGDILELGTYAKDLHLSIAEDIDDSIDIVFTYGENARLIGDEVIKNNSQVEVTHFTEKAKLITTLKTEAVKGNLIFFKASRGMAFEQFVQELMI